MVWIGLKGNESVEVLIPSQAWRLRKTQRLQKIGIYSFLLFQCTAIQDQCKGPQSLFANESTENIWHEVFSSPGWVLPTPAVSRSPWHRRATLAQGALTMIRAKCQRARYVVEEQQSAK